MESKKIYEDSYNELTRIKKTINMNNVTINFDKLDAASKELLTITLLNSINNRQTAILNVIGNQTSGV